METNNVSFMIKSSKLDLGPFHDSKYLFYKISSTPKVWGTVLGESRG
jgi:hypothetical protein